MSVWHLILAEIHHRGLTFGLALVAVATAAALFVAGPTIVESYRSDTESRLAEMEKQADEELAKVEKETIQIMRDLGFNLRIFHKNTDPGRLLANFQAFDMPEEYVARLASSKELTKVAHLVATLRQMIDWNGEPRVLVGFAEESPQSTSPEKRPMGYKIKSGTVFLGHVAGKGHQVGETIEVLGKKFQVAQILDEHGTREEDIAILMSLPDAQKLLDKPGRISEIVALGCRCKTVKRVEEIRAQLEAVLPEAQVVEHKLAADARDKERKLLAAYHQDAISEFRGEREKISGVMGGLVVSVVPLTILASAIFVGVLAWLNVRERQSEIGLLRAVGKDTSFVIGLFLGRAGLIGLVGGTIGCVLGMYLAQQLAVHVLEIPDERFALHSIVMMGGIVGAPLVAIIASWLPAIFAAQQDPSTILAET